MQTKNNLKGSKNTVKSTKKTVKKKVEKTTLLLDKKEKKKDSFFTKMKNYFCDDSYEEIPEEDNSFFTTVEVVVIIIISILFGVVLGYMLTYSNSPFHRVKHSALDEIVNTYENIIDNYYGELDEKKLSDAAIKGMIHSLGDPYSSYMDENVTEEFNETVDGSFVGIGVTITPDGDYTKIIDIYKNSPALEVGLQVDDKIIKVEGTDVAGFNGDQLSQLIRGKKGTKVTITILRGEEEFEYTLTRGTIDLISVSGEVLESDEKKIGYIRITSFASNTYDQFEEKLKELEGNDITSLIIDVRDNPGGHLLQTKQILSMFFSKKTVLYQVETKKKKQNAYSLTKESRKYPVVVLMNSASASASEILASCFQENYKKAYLIGTQTYGKGTVQKSENLQNGTSIKFTTQKWLSSKGVWYNNEGVKPDIEVELAEEYYQNPIRENDNQFQEAITKIKELYEK